MQMQECYLPLMHLSAACQTPSPASAVSLYEARLDRTELTNHFVAVQSHSAESPHNIVLYHNAFITYDPSYSIATRGPDLLGYALPVQYLTKQRFEVHASGDKSHERSTTPFISIFQNFARACELVQVYIMRGHHNMCTMRIVPKHMAAMKTRLASKDGAMWLPTWLGEGCTVFVSMREVRRFLR